ncbi:cyclin-dependent protein kinase inhibitor SMR3-like [Diospyros lotus]|uniref:cyclin-dependent protein kinase inhibitor SMR3-like n=1 Tax=Diospyros lotus TaxID=55363 RepID=UPI00224E5CFA|nr:cyclin-dependent protein kinase inhibitor SMR3-like [Diospyros lotus]
MSNSDLFDAKDDNNQKEFEGSSKSRPTFEGSDIIQATASTDRSDPETAPSSGELKEPASLGEFETDETDADNEGFRTPTSSKHKIPVLSRCPPAPKKLRPSPSAKRKASPPLRRSLEPDLSKDVESVFRPHIAEDSGRKMKRARRDNSESE